MCLMPINCSYELLPQMFEISHKLLNFSHWVDPSGVEFSLSNGWYSWWWTGSNTCYNLLVLIPLAACQRWVGKVDCFTLNRVFWEYLDLLHLCFLALLHLCFLNFSPQQQVQSPHNQHWSCNTAQHWHLKWKSWRFTYNCIANFVV